MMTHKTYRFLVKRDHYTASKATVISLLTELAPGEEAPFVPGEVLYRKEFEGFEPLEKIVVLARVNLDSETKRRYILHVGKYTPASTEAVTPATSETQATSSDDEQSNEVVGEPKSAEQDSLEKRTFYIEPQHAEVFNTATSMLTQQPDRPVKILMVGPAGYGKTSIGREYAKAKDMAIYRQDCASVRDPEEWFGYREAVDGNTVFVKSEMMEVIERGNAVIILDEFNRVEPYLHNSIYHLLEPDAEPIIHGERFTIGPNILFIMTINVGFRHSGTFQLDEAIISRVDMICEVGVLPVSVEAKVLHRVNGISIEDAKTIVEVAGAIRSLEVIECSTRTTLQIARSVSAGLPVRSAFEHSVVKRCRADMTTVEFLKSVIDAINTKIGTYTPPTSNDFI